MDDFKHITDWELKSGSHEFPGPSGGTCINEAAIVAAGFEYRKVDGVSDFPPCFSTVLGYAALCLNDSIIYSDLRTNLLMPFVTRLSGSADCEQVERIRARSILLDSANAMFRALRHKYDSTHPRMVESGMGAIRSDDYWNQTSLTQQIMDTVISRLWMIDNPADPQPFIAMNAISEWLQLAMGARLDARRLAHDFTAALAKGFEIGNKATDLDAAMVVERMDSTKAEAKARETVTA